MPARAPFLKTRYGGYFHRDMPAEEPGQPVDQERLHPQRWLAGLHRGVQPSQHGERLAIGNDRGTELG